MIPHVNLIVPKTQRILLARYHVIQIRKTILHQLIVLNTLTTHRVKLIVQPIQMTHHAKYVSQLQ